jgi:CRISPR-associated endonuclease/helicase Cas3
LLKAADHFGSAFSYNTEKQLSSLFEKPDLSFYLNEARESDLFPLSKVDPKDKREHTLVVAPTGAGKTDFLLKRTQGRVFYTLPFQASINAMWNGSEKVFPIRIFGFYMQPQKLWSKKIILKNRCFNPWSDRA